MHFQIYDKKQVFKCLFMLVLMVSAMHFTKGAGFAIIAPFALIALTRNRPDEIFFYILAMVSSIVTNPTIATKGTFFYIEQRIMLMGFGFLLALRAAGAKKSPLVTPFLGIFIYLFYMAFTSSAGWSPIISYLKLLLFSITYLAFLGAANAAATHPRTNIIAVRSVILSVAAFFIIGSIALLPFPAIGQMKPELFIDNPSANITSLFMGMTNQPQCLGPIISGFAVLIFTDLIFGVRKMSKVHIFLLACCPILVYKTSSRTAMGTFAAGIMFASYFFMRARWVGRRWRSKIMSCLWLGAIALAILVACSGSIREGATNFIRKHGGDNDITLDSVVSSRMGLVDTAMANFKKSPIFGNGFQVSEAMANKNHSRGTSLLSAPIEKGVWVTAVLEEGGAIGFVLFASFILTALVRTIKLRAYATASVFLVLTVSNFGEFTFFSTSYSGGILWSLVFTGIALDAARLKAEQQERYASFRHQNMAMWR
jgi:hypothetical protein